MSAALVWSNVLTYTLQVGLLVGLGASLPALLRLKSPGARLMYWQLLLVSCLALPWVRPWLSEVIAVTSAPVVAIQAVPQMLTDAAPRSSVLPFAVIALWILAAGVAVRLAWLAAGFLKLALYRRHARSIPSPLAWTGAAGNVRLLLSEEISGPVTFGFFRPVVLLPASFPSLSDATRDAILFHELLHVERRDWLFTVAEELVRAALWFHPAIWWVLGEIQLAREQTVDLAVIEMTQARESYVDALLAMAGAAQQPDLAPAPLFLKRRHLKQRVKEIVQEVRMSKTRLILAQVAALALMFAACWIVTDAIPLHAQPQVVADGAGITVNLNGLQLMHRTPVTYPADALAKGVEGSVVVQIKLDATGQVVDDAILSGPDELRRGVQQSVLNWHFDKSAASSTRVVKIDFVKPANSTVAPASAPVPTQAQIVAPALVPRSGSATGTTLPAETRQEMQQKVMGFVQDLVAQADQRLDQLRQQQAQAPTGQLAQEIQDQEKTVLEMHKKLLLAQANLELIRSGNGPIRAPQGSTPEAVVKIEQFDVSGISDSAKEQLLAQLPVHVGDAYSEEAAQKMSAAVRQFDQHLTVSSAAAGRVIRIFLQEDNAPPVPGAVRIGSNVMAANLINAVKPVYPQLAKMARVQGTVRFDATIGKDGTMQDLKLVSGPPLLVQAALDAVKDWVYKPTLLNGAPVDVLTTIDVTFTLAGEPPPPAQ